MTDLTRATDKERWLTWCYAIVLFVIHGAGMYFICKSAYLWIFAKQCCCDELWYGLICRYVCDIMPSAYKWGQVK